MKITDTIGSVLKNKGEARVLAIAPEQSGKFRLAQTLFPWNPEAIFG